MKFNNILESVGNTPHVRINRLFDDKLELWMKLERVNPGASIKDRIALAMIEDAEKKGILKAGSTIIEPTSGNTGIGLAMVAAVKGYRIILVMPESMSKERRSLMLSYGAEFELTPREAGMPGAIKRAEEMLNEINNAWMPQQFENEANVNTHKENTAQEILADFSDGLDYLITGVGTGGHISGCAHILKEKMPKLQVLAVEPAKSPAISSGRAGPHTIQGIGAGFVPANLHCDVIDGTIQVKDSEAYEFARRCAKEEGILVGISTGASLAAISQKLGDFNPGTRVLTFCYDTGERYLSVEGFLA